MRKPAAIVTVAMLLGLILAPAGAQQEGSGKKKEGPPAGSERKGPPPPPREAEKPGGKCGKDVAGYVEEIRKRKDGRPEDLGGAVQEHFKLWHPDGCCHCLCGHRPAAEKPAPREGGVGLKPEGKCGRDPGAYQEELKRKGLGRDECERNAKEHFRKHPDGVCHCTCSHKDGRKAPLEKPAARDGGGEKKPGVRDGDGEKKPERKCGRDPGAYQEDLKRRGFGKDECEKNAKEHFRSHPDGACHCTCNHEDEGRKEGGAKEGGAKDGRKGNNGVGNGQDPPPPGKPPVNDGPGTRPGNPGNKGGGEGRK
ncbi:MAG TPA: hypothetical protein VJB14_15175 [Planctomycetota bacterium]|nr:hypothetical protein [Planctomycetota bacterium]